MCRRILSALLCVLLLCSIVSCLAGSPDNMPEKLPLKAGKVHVKTPLWEDKLHILSEQTGDMSRIYHIEKIDPSIRYFTFNRATADAAVTPQEGVTVTWDANTFLPLYTVRFENSVEIEIRFPGNPPMARGDTRSMCLSFYDEMGNEVTRALFCVTKIAEQYVFYSI